MVLKKVVPTYCQAAGHIYNAYPLKFGELIKKGSVPLTLAILHLRQGMKLTCFELTIRLIYLFFKRFSYYRSILMLKNLKWKPPKSSN